MMPIDDTTFWLTVAVVVLMVVNLGLIFFICWKGRGGAPAGAHLDADEVADQDLLKSKVWWTEYGKRTHLYCDCHWIRERPKKDALICWDCIKEFKKKKIEFAKKNE